MSTLKDGSLAGSRVPSQKQKDYGNYEKAHRVVHGMRISIENAATTDRVGTDPDGKEWRQKLSHDYGYIRGTTGKDKDHIDAFLGPDCDDPNCPVHVIDQDKKGGGSVFDEHKVMLGFKTPEDAIIAYHRNYEPGWDGFRAATPMDIGTFRDWAYAGRSGKRKPASEYAAFKEQDNGNDNGSREGDGGESRQRTLPESSVQRTDLRVRPADQAVSRLPGSDAGSRAPSRVPGVPAHRGDQDGAENGYADGGLVPGSSQGTGRLVQERTGTHRAVPSAGAKPGSGRAAPQVLAGARLAGTPKSPGWYAAQRKAGKGGAGQRPGADYAGGGTVDDGTMDWSQSEQGDDGSGRPFIGYPSARRGQNPVRSGETRTSDPRSILRGVLAGTVGLPGDLEGFGRVVASAVSGNPVAETLGKAIPGLGLLQKALGSSPDTTARLPTSEFYNEYLPGRIDDYKGRKADETAGNFIGMLPNEVAGAASKVAREAAPVIKGALTRMAENAAAPRVLNSQAGAIKLPGGNWTPGSVEAATRRVVGTSRETIDAMRARDPSKMGIEDWMDKRLSKYVRNQMGTATDPLLKLEQEGRLHLTPDQLGEMARESRTKNWPMPQGHAEWEPGMPEIGAHESDPVHEELTGRKYKTQWEALSDNAVEPMGARRALRESMTVGNTPQWLMDLGNNSPASQVHQAGTSSLHDLGFSHVRDYLDAATLADQFGTKFGGVDGLTKELNRVGAGPDDYRYKALGLLQRNLHINPDDLGKMSLPDVIRKTADWNDYLAQTQKLQDVNKGVKEVLKQYPDTGHQWVELDSQGLQGEGDAMGHCVGGYCSSVDDGSTRILSLRDKEGQPHVTVELQRGAPVSSEGEEMLAPGVMEAVEKRASDLASAEGHAPESNDWSDSYGDHYMEQLQAAIADHNSKLSADTPWNILQIKGKGNKAPIKDYLPAVQDLVRNMGPWGPGIRDFGNTGLVHISPEAPFNLNLGGGRAIKLDKPGLYTRDELRQQMLDQGASEEETKFLQNWGGSPYNARNYAAGGLVRELAESAGKKLPDLMNAIRESAGLNREIHTVTDGNSAYRTVGTQFGANPSKDVVDSYASTPGMLTDFHTHPPTEEWNGATPSPEDLQFWSQAYGKRKGPTNMVIAQPPLLARYGGNDVSGSERLGQGSSFMTSNMARTMNPSRYRDALGDVKYSMGRTGQIEDLLGQELGKGTTGDILDELVPLILQQHYQDTGLGRSRVMLPRTKDLGPEFRSGDEVMRVIGDPVKGFLKGKGYAEGGTISNRQTVGLGTFGGADNQPQAQSGGQGAGGWGNLGGGMQPAGQNGYAAMPVATNGGAPSSTQAPTFSTQGLDSYMNKPQLDIANLMRNDPQAAAQKLMTMTPEERFKLTPEGRKADAMTMDPALMAQIVAGNQGNLSQGAGSLLGANYSLADYQSGPEGSRELVRDNSDALYPVAAQLGINTGAYGQSMAEKQRLLNDIDKASQDYYTVTGMSSGWNGSNNPRGASQTMYRRQGDQLVPIMKPQNYIAQTDPGWIKGRGAEGITAASMILPAFGGWAGLFGQAAGTAGATAANIAGNAALGYARGGAGGALSSLAGGLGGVAGGALGNQLGSQWGQLGSQVGTKIGQYAYNQTRQN